MSHLEALRRGTQHAFQKFSKNQISLTSLLMKCLTVQHTTHHAFWILDCTTTRNNQFRVKNHLVAHEVSAALIHHKSWCSSKVWLPKVGPDSFANVVNISFYDCANALMVDESDCQPPPLKKRKKNEASFLLRRKPHL